MRGTSIAAFAGLTAVPMQQAWTPLPWWPSRPLCAVASGIVEQGATMASRHADPAGSLRMVAFAGSGKSTALRLLAEANTIPAL